MSERKPILCLDFDGVLDSYTARWECWMCGQRFSAPYGDAAKPTPRKPRTNGAQG